MTDETIDFKHGMHISTTEPDWTREHVRQFWDPSRKLLKAIRDFQRVTEKRGPLAVLGRKSAVLRHRFWSVVAGADIPLTSKLAGGLALPHPNGVVLHPETVIGPNCILFQQVTLGASPGQAPPELGGHVDIMAGAKVVGSVKIGDHALIGANAVVTSDIPEGAIAVGIPAKVIGSRLPSSEQ